MVMIKLLKLCERDPMKRCHAMPLSPEMDTIMKGTFVKSKLLDYFGHKIDYSGKKQLAVMLLEDIIFAKK